MEHKSANEFDTRVTRMAAALRDEPMPSVPTGFAVQSSIRQSRVPVRTVVACGGACATLAVVVMLSVPQESAASVLRRMASRADESLRHELNYQLEQDGTWKITHEYYVSNGHFHLIPHGNEMETYVDGNKRYDVDRTRNYALVEDMKRPVGKAFFYEASLKRQLNLDHVKWVKRDGKAVWRGQSLDRFQLHSEFVDGLGQNLQADSVLYADVSADRPYYEQTTVTGDKEGVFKDGRAVAVEWEYPAEAGNNLTVSLPKGMPVYEPAKMREQVKEQVLASVQTQMVEGIKVTLRAVYANDWGRISVFTTGGTGRIERDPQGLRIDGKDADGITASADANHGHWAGGDSKSGGKWVFEPLKFRGLKLVYQATTLSKGFGIPDEFDLDVPVWKADDSRYGRSFVGYARFKAVVPIRYNGDIFSDGMNGPIGWGDEDFKKENPNSEPGQERGGMATTPG